MLKKLLKHEWEASWKIPTILIGVLLVISLFAGLTFAAPVWESEMHGLSFLLVLVWMLYYFAIIGVSIGVVLYLAIRFYKNMYTDEGYLTHTLPVTSHQLLWSKMIPMAAWNVIATIGILISVAIFGLMAIGFLQPDGMGIWETITYMAEEMVAELGIENMAGCGISMLAVGVAGVCSGTMMTVGAVTIGQLVGKHKVLGSIGAYFGINTVMQFVVSACMVPFMFNMAYEETDSVFGVLMPSYFIMAAIYIILSVALYFVSEWIIRKKLNLD